MVRFHTTAALLGLVLAAPAAAQATGPQLVRLSVVDRDGGGVKPEYAHAGRHFVAAQTGARYSVRLANLTAARVLVVLSVDGVNAVSGETAAAGQRGYILAPYQTSDIAGWRKSDAEIAAFRFAPLDQSYAARTGRPGEVGVIGIAVFRERVPPPPVVDVSPPVSRTRIAPPPPPMPAPAAPAPAAPAAARLGTAHGEIEASRIVVLPFERAAATPASVRLVEYDSVDNLIAAGVLPSDDHRPRPFPAHSRDGYVPDPPPAS